MRTSIFIIISILISSVITAQNEADTSKFIQNLRNDIEKKKYTWVTNKKKIPKSVYSYIIHWKRQDEGKKEKPEFNIANPKEDYNSGCFVKPKLPFRRLIFAGSNDKEWIIFYDHGQGRVQNSKILYIDTQNGNSISFFYALMPFSVGQTVDEKEKILLNSINAKNLCLFQGKSDLSENSASF